jgi:anti-sigma B factor antagonist
MAMRIEENEVRPGLVVITITGRVTLSEPSTEIEKVVIRLIGENKRDLIFELSGVTHIDSTGIGRFISGLNSLRQAGGSLRMAGATGQVRDSFRVTRLDTIFKFDEDLEASLKAAG